MMKRNFLAAGGGIGWLLAASFVGAPQIFLAPEDGGGGGGDPAGNPGGGDPGGGGPQIYRPEGLPDHLAGKDDRETTDRIWNAYQGSRRELSERGTVPQDLSAYAFEISDKAKPLIQIGDDDKVVPALRELAQKHKLTDKQFGGFMNEFFDKIVDLGVIEQPINPDQLFVDLAPAEFKGTDAEKKAAGGQRLATAQAWIHGLTENHGFDKDMRDELAMLTTSKPGVRILENLMKGGMQHTVTPGGGNPGTVTAEDLQKRTADPRGDRNSDKYEPSFAEETKRLYKQVHGD